MAEAPQQTGLDPGPHVPHALTADERTAWARDGFFVRERIFAATELERFRSAAEAMIARADAACAASDDRYTIDGNEYVEVDFGAHPSTVQMEHQPGSRTIRVIEPFHYHDPVFESLVDDPRLVEPMRGLIGTERVAIFTDKMNCKRPREGSRFDWHQDSPYWSHFTDDLERLPNVLVTFDDADAHNGCFRVIRGSHREGCLPGRHGEGTLGPLFTHHDAFDDEDQWLAAVPAGSAVFFSPHTVHGSEPNRSDAARRAVVLTYQPGGRRMFKLEKVRDAG